MNTPIRNIPISGIRVTTNEIAGIDTGVNTGLAFWNYDRQEFVALSSMKIHTAMHTVKMYRPDFVRVEDPRLMVLSRKFQKHNDPRTLQNVGSVKRDAKIWGDFLTDLGIPFQMVSPADNIRKLKAADFNQRTGWAGKSNEHGRDAAMLVNGASARNVRNWIKMYG